MGLCLNFDAAPMKIKRSFYLLVFGTFVIPF